MENVKVLDKSEVLSLEPFCKFDNALNVPQAGVVDYGVVTRKLASKFQSLGGTIEYFQNIKSIKTAVLWKKKDSTFEPDFCAQKLDSNPWIVQPFERYEEVKVEDLIKKHKS